MMRCKLLIFLVACTYCAATRTVQTAQYEYLDKHIIAHLDVKVDPCTDMYSFTCGNNDTRTSEIAASKYHEAMDYAKTILSSHDAHGYTSIAVEQELYHQCMRHGHENKQTLIEIKEKVKLFEELLLDVTSRNFKWQKIDHKIAKMGLGNAFFNIKVIRDPLNIRSKIIMLEPPSAMSLRNILITLENINEADLKEENWSDKTEIISFFRAVKRNGLDLVRGFLAYLIKIIEDTSSLDLTKILSERMTIREWSRKYNRQSTIANPPTTINWPEIIYNEFYKININLYDTEPILVKNIHYFSRLFNALFEHPNDIIAVTLIAKAAAENLRYIDYDFAQHLHKMDRPSFCARETKLFGVSHKILFDLCKDTIDKQETYKIQEVLYNILEEVKSTIYNTRFSFAEESYLLSELQDMTSHVGFLSQLQRIANDEGLHTWSPRSLPEYYETFQRNNSYFNNIISYREMLKLKELRSLKSPSQTWEPTPFSILDIHVPANRFVLNVFFNRAYLQNNYYKEQVFGTYGAKIATLIYGLLSENKALDNSYYDYRLRAHPDFVLETNCVDSNIGHNMPEANRIVSSAVGLDIAYSAMSRPISSRVDLPPIINPLAFKSIWKADQIFFVAYSLAHCDLNSSSVNDIIYHSSKFSVGFPNCLSECTYKPFHNLDKNMFFIKM